jgi:hypothetical protein
MTSLGEGTFKIIGTQGCALRECLVRTKFYKIWWAGNYQVVVSEIKVLDEIFEF